MAGLFLRVAFGFFAVFSVGVSEAQEYPKDLPDLIRKAKPSVVLVGTFGDLDSPRFTFRGTGFVVGDGRRIITNAHVLPEFESAKSRFLVVQHKNYAGDWRPRRVERVVSDKTNDLAVLDIEGPPLQALSLKSGEVAEGTSVAFMGFPIGGALGFSHVTHRATISALTPVALPAPTGSTLSARNIAQLRTGAFKIMQLDGTAYPGNSGGPVFEISTGEVVGVINMVLLKSTKESALSHPSGISYAIPVDAVQRMLMP